MTGLRDPEVQATMLAPGVFFLAGGTHNSLAVEQANRVILVEAPLYPARGAALLAWAAAQFPGKPVTHVIATHYHDDHAGGLRELVAAGATVMAGDAPGVQAAYLRSFTAPSAIEPDRLAQHPVDPVLVLAPASSTPELADPDRPVRIIAVPNSHANGMVMAYLPNQRIVFESDLFSPGLPPKLPAAYAAELDATIAARGLAVDKIVGGHGGVGTLADLHAAH